MMGVLVLTLGGYSNINQCPAVHVYCFAHLLSLGKPFATREQGISKQTVDQAADAFPVLRRLKSNVRA